MESMKLEPWSPTPPPDAKEERLAVIRERPTAPGTVPSLGCCCVVKKPCSGHSRSAPRRTNMALVEHTPETVAYWNSVRGCLGKVDAAAYPIQQENLFVFRRSLRLLSRHYYPGLIDTKSEAYRFISHFLYGRDLRDDISKEILAEYLPGARVHYRLQDCHYHIEPDRSGFWVRKRGPDHTPETTVTGTWMYGPLVREVIIVYQTSSTGYEAVVVEQWDTYHGLGVVCSARDITIFATNGRV